MHRTSWVCAIAVTSALLASVPASAQDDAIDVTSGPTSLELQMVEKAKGQIRDGYLDGAQANLKPAARHGSIEAMCLLAQIQDVHWLSRHNINNFTSFVNLEEAARLYSQVEKAGKTCSTDRQGK